MLIPDLMFASYKEISADFLAEKGIRLLICDLDNTFAPYEQPLPDEDNIRWFDGVKKAGITVVFLSNNHGERVRLFCEKAGGLACYPDAKKPLTRVARRVMADHGVEKENVAVLGDQIFTDVWTGKNLGVTTLMVPPIKDKTNLFFKAKRLLERPLIRRYAEKHGYAPYMAFWHVKEKK